MTTALTAILHGARDLRLESRPLGELAPGGVLVRTEVTALSTGTDLGNYLGRSTDVPGAPDYPRGVGYSNVGVVAGTGQRVFSMKPHVSAFHARPTDLLVPVPPGVSPESASLAYLAQLGVAALRQIHFAPGERVAIVGLGVIGLCTCAMARAMGAREVIAVANASSRAEAALAMGAHTAAVTNEDKPPQDIDAVVLTANPWAAYRQAVDMARHGGRVAVLGFPGRGEEAPPFNPLDARWFYAKQLTLVGAGFSPRIECSAADVPFNLRRNLEFILHALATGAVDFTPAISHRFPAPRMQEAYELALAHDKTLRAAIFDWRD